MFDLIKRLFGATPGTPTKPVSTALDVVSGAYGRPLQEAISIIDIIHRDGNLPVIPVKRLPLGGKHGQFTFTPGGPARGIAVSHVTRHPELTTLHEVGHFLDYEGLGTSQHWASVSDPLLEDWRRAAAASRAIQRLGQIYTWPADTFPETISPGNVVEFDIDSPFIEYLLQSEEVWARSYCQYIVAKSGRQPLRDQLNYRRSRPNNGIFYAEQWDDDDFSQIEAEIDTVFRRLGWVA